jgi:hypothetical protein
MRSRYSLIFLIVAWNLFDHIYTPIHHLMINMLYPGISYG